MMRLVDLAVIDGENHVYRLPGARVEHVFDGDAALETSCYQIDAIDKRLKLKHPPASNVRALVRTNEGGHLKNFVPDIANVIGVAGQERVLKPSAYGASLHYQSSDDHLAKLVAQGFESVIRELREMRRDLSQVRGTISSELKRANSR